MRSRLFSGHARRLLIFAAVALASGGTALGQGISFVTRRTPTLQKQVLPRQFFDAAGLPTAGANSTGSSSSTAGNPVLSSAENPASPDAPTAPALAGTRVDVPPSTPAALPASGTAKPGLKAVPAMTPVRLPPPGPARGYIVPPTPPPRLARATNSPAANSAVARRTPKP